MRLECSDSSVNELAAFYDQEEFGRRASDQQVGVLEIDGHQYPRHGEEVRECSGREGGRREGGREREGGRVRGGKEDRGEREGGREEKSRERKEGG